MRRFAALTLALVLPFAAAGLAEPDRPDAGPAVTARSIGYETPCAEMDNVVVELSGRGVATFDIRATHPSYLAPGLADITAADFADCEFPDRPVWEFAPFTTILHEDERIRLVGHRLTHSWRPELVDVAVGDRAVRGLHLTQLVVKDRGGDVEVLVLYPSDGYWRAKPLPPPDRTDTVFGSSFAVGPLSRAHRPFVRLERVSFDPEALAYRLEFAEGGSAVLRVVSIGRDALELRVTLDLPAADAPFALFSSMHVAPDNADVARVAVAPPDGGEPRVVTIDRLGEAAGLRFAFGRDSPSRHNTSAPDLTFGPFHGR